MRIFVSIDIPEEARYKIKKIQEALPEFYGKKTELENLHLTLKFLGEVDEEKVELIKDKLKEIKFERFEAEIDLIGVFSEKFVRIVWLHLKGAEELQKKIDEKLESLFEPEKRFMSHLTIARVKELKDKKLFLEKLKEIKFYFRKFNVDCFKLKQSVLTNEKAIYGTLEEYKSSDF